MAGLGRIERHTVLVLSSCCHLGSDGVHHVRMANSSIHGSAVVHVWVLDTGRTAIIVC